MTKTALKIKNYSTSLIDTFFEQDSVSSLSITYHIGHDDG